MGARHILFKEHKSKMRVIIDRYTQDDFNRDNFWRIYRADKEGKYGYVIDKIMHSVSIKDNKLRLELVYVTKVRSIGRKFFAKEVSADSIIINLKKGEWYWNQRSFDRRGRKKRGSWKNYMKKNPFRSRELYSESQIFHKMDYFNEPEQKRVISHFLGDYTHSYYGIIDWFCNFHGIIKPDCHYEMMALYPGKKWITKYPKLIEAILRSAKNYTRTLNGLMQKTATQESSSESPAPNLKQRNYKSVVPDKLFGKEVDHKNTWWGSRHYDSKLTSYFSEKDSDLREANMVTTHSSSTTLKYDMSIIFMMIKLLGHEAFGKLPERLYTKAGHLKEEDKGWDSYSAHGLETFLPIFQMIRENRKDVVLRKDDALKVVNLHQLVMKGRSVKRRSEFSGQTITHAENVTFQDLGDHIKQMARYEELTGEKWKLRAETIKSFKNEHQIISKLLRTLDREEFRLNFDKKMIDIIEKQIKGWSPYVLKSTDDYINEGEHQHNCVYGYNNSYGYSFIVSLRKGKTRITCECKYNGELTQARGVCNEDPKEKPLINSLRKRLATNKLSLNSPEKEYLTLDMSDIVKEAEKAMATV